MDGISINGTFTTDEGIDVVVAITDRYEYSAIISGYKEDEYDSIPKVITIMSRTITDLCNKINFFNIEGIYIDQIERFLINTEKLNDKLERI